MDTSTRNASYTAASTIPAKLFSDNTVFSIREHRIRPLHVQVNPTNKCPLKCSFCSCQNMDRKAEMPIEMLKSISRKFIALGTKAFTITGGGDPLAYTHLEEYLEFLKDNGQHIGMVTNGVLFNKYDPRIFAALDWCRLSVSDERDIQENELLPTISTVGLDWSFSYVLLRGLQLPNLMIAINFANKHQFTHVRIVDDIIDPKTTSMKRIQQTLEEYQMDLSRVIWQGRKDYSRGHERCLISLLKPNIDVYGNMTGCCGVQYASEPPMLDFTRYFRMCGVNEIEKVYAEQKYFDGSKCQRCYYADYNNVLDAMWVANDLKHKEFK